MTNEATDYGVTIEPANATGTVWRAVNVRHLSGSENRGRHNIFIKAFGPSGNRDRNPALRASWEWEGQRFGEYARPAQLDKRDGEIGHGDIPIEKGQIVTVWISGDGVPSDRVSGIHIMHADEDAGNTWGHHSFAIEFQRVDGATITPPIEPPTDPIEPPTGDLAAEIAKIWRLLQAQDRLNDKAKALWLEQQKLNQAIAEQTARNTAEIERIMKWADSLSGEL